ELLGVGQDQAVGEGLQELPEPLVAGGGLDDGLEGAEPGEEGDDALGVGTEELFAVEYEALLVEDTDGDSLFVEVDADVVHGDLLLWKVDVAENSRHIWFTTDTRTPLRGSTS